MGGVNDLVVLRDPRDLSQTECGFDDQDVPGISLAALNLGVPRPRIVPQRTELLGGFGRSDLLQGPSGKWASLTPTSSVLLGSKTTSPLSWMEQ